MTLDIEDIEKALEGKPEINRLQHIERITRLIKHAVPGNLAWRILENEYGFSGDYTEADHGEPPQGAQW